MSGPSGKPVDTVDDWSGCANCDGDGWVCEEHTWAQQSHGGCGGAGAPCPACNPLATEFAKALHRVAELERANDVLQARVNVSERICERLDRLEWEGRPCPDCGVVVQFDGEGDPVNEHDTSCMLAQWRDEANVAVRARLDSDTPTVVTTPQGGGFTVFVDRNPNDSEFMNMRSLKSGEVCP